jgi:uncharacterized protein Smg (DUF494 family)
MKQSLLELVDVILQKIQDRSGDLPSEKGIRTWLVLEGYAKGDIDAAMKLVGPRFSSASPVRERGPGQVRLLSPYEAYKLTPEARDALVRLELYDVIDTSEREYILERLDQFEGTVGLSELDYLVSWIVCANRDVESQQTIFNVMEGNTQTRH